MRMEKKVPEIRFKEFSREWENKKIGRILTEIKRPIELMDNTSYQLVTVKRRNEGIVPRAVLKGKNILVKNYFSVEAGDYLISKRQVVHGANGIVPDNLDGAVVSNEYLVVTDSDDITARYWTVISIRPEMHKLFFISSYGVDIEKLVFDVTDWKNRTIFIPQVTEQKNITDYFKKLDSLIAQHKKKHDKLSSIKKAMLEKMFPNQGKTTPEIRFKGFSGEWKEIVLASACLNFRSGKFIKSEDIKRVGAYPVYGGNGLRGYTSEYNHEGKYAIIGRQGALCGNMNFSNGKAFFTEHAIAVQANEKNDTLFLYYKLGLMNLGQYSGQSAQPGLSVNKLTALEIFIPEKAEQTAIGNYFQKLDTLIDQHQQQITKLNNIKQSCLSKMFV